MFDLPADGQGTRQQPNIDRHLVGMQAVADQMVAFGAVVESFASLLGAPALTLALSERGEAETAVADLC